MRNKLIRRNGQRIKPPLAGMQKCDQIDYCWADGSFFPIVNSQTAVGKYIDISRPVVSMQKGGWALVQLCIDLIHVTKDVIKQFAQLYVLAEHRRRCGFGQVLHTVGCCADVNGEV